MPGMSASLSNRELLRRLVGFDTTSVNSNAALADFICGYLERDGARIERQTCDDPAKVNLLVMAGPEPADDSGLLLSGHMDVVPAVEPEWESDPFDLTERNGALYGRGSCDMKGFVALAINLFRSFDRSVLTRPFGLLLTCDEELGTLGAQHFANNWPEDRPLPRSVLVGEPTSLHAVRMHKGHVTMRIELTGVSAHSGSPHLGVNAIEPAAEIIMLLRAFRQELQEQRGETSRYFPEVPYPVLNIATIEGGTADNIVPDHCVIHLGIRLLPGQTSAGPVQRVCEAVESVMRGRAFEVEVLNESPPLLLDERAEVCRALCGLIGQSQTFGVTYASDAGPLQQTLGMECVLFGPGTIDVAHKPNEHLPIAEWERAVPIVEALVRRMCTS